MNILIVEDRPVDLKLARQILLFAGHRVSEAIMAEHVFESIRADRPDMILLDLVLPGIDGLALARMLRTDPVTRNIPIVAVTSQASEYSKAAALAAGCDAWIPKPISTRELSGQLSAVAAGKPL